MHDTGRRETYRRIWNRVREVYDTGYMVSEAGLQAALYMELRTAFPKDRIVVEPTWEQRGGNIFHDIVVVSEEPAITDIFEIKFVPQGYPVWQEDIGRLLRHSGGGDAAYPVSLHSNTGTWKGPVDLAKKCRLHFVAVGQHDAEAVSISPAMIATHFPDFPEAQGAVSSWYGRLGDSDEEWGIRFAS